MTFEQLKRLFPTATRKTWHKHPNGGGWVKNTAFAGTSTFIGENALVYGTAKVLNQAQIYDNACVYGNSMVCRNAEVYGNAVVKDSAIVSGNARVCGWGVVSDNAKVAGDAKVTEKVGGNTEYEWGSAPKKNSFTISGSAISLKKP